MLNIIRLFHFLFFLNAKILPSLLLDSICPFGPYCYGNAKQPSSFTLHYET